MGLQSADIAQPIVISEDEFELAMGLFEKVTHQKTEFLHHVCYCITCNRTFNVNSLYSKDLEQGSPFPPFSEYQDTSSNELGLNVFAAFAVSSWIPPSQQLIRFAKAIYPN